MSKDNPWISRNTLGCRNIDIRTSPFTINCPDRSKCESYCKQLSAACGQNDVDKCEYVPYGSKNDYYNPYACSKIRWAEKNKAACCFGEQNDNESCDPLWCPGDPVGECVSNPNDTSYKTLVDRCGKPVTGPDGIPTSRLLQSGDSCNTWYLSTVSSTNPSKWAALNHMIENYCSSDIGKKSAECQCYNARIGCTGQNCIPVQKVSETDVLVPKPVDNKGIPIPLNNVACWFPPCQANVEKVLKTWPIFLESRKCPDFCFQYRGNTRVRVGDLDPSARKIEIGQQVLSCFEADTVTNNNISIISRRGDKADARIYVWRQVVNVEETLLTSVVSFTPNIMTLSQNTLIFPKQTYYKSMDISFNTTVPAGEYYFILVLRNTKTDTNAHIRISYQLNNK